MPDFAGPTLTEADMWGITPFDQLYCRIKFRQAEYRGIYTPLRLGPSIRTPGELGGIDWGSVSVDEGRGILVVNSNLMADYDQFITRAAADKERLFIRGDPRRGKTPPGAAMEGTPYAVHWHGFLTGLGIPCQRPPYGFLTAVDLKTGNALWQHTLGNASNSGPFGISLHLPLPLGTPNIGGSIVTKGGLIFIAATQDKYFRAVDEKTGKVLWEVQLPAGGHATPITYLGRDGRQYVLINAGGSTSFGTGSSDAFIAYRLKS
jgi:quinoprotein glucose dehydrogenase